MKKLRKKRTQRKAKEHFSVSLLKLIRRRYITVCLSAICLLLLISHTFYVFKTYQYPEIDEHTYMAFSVAFYKLMKQHGLFAFPEMIQYLIDHPPFRQPLYPFLLSLLYLVFGISNSYKIALWVNGLFYCGTIIGVYFLCKFFLNKAYGLLCAFIFAFYGFPLFYLHFTYSETFVTMSIVVSLVLLTRTERFNNTRFSVYFGLSLLIALLSRWIAVFFIISPALLLFASAVFRKDTNRKIFAKNIGFIFLVILPAVAFYILTLPSLQSYFGLQQKFSAEWIDAYKNNPYLKNAYSFQSMAYYFKVFEQNTIVLFGIFIAGLVYALRYFKKYAFLLLAFLTPYANLTFATSLKDDRYIVPIYPIIAIISVLALQYIPTSARRIVVALIIIVSLGNFFGAVWGIGPMRHGLQSVTLAMQLGHPRTVHLSPVSWPPSQNTTNVTKIVSLIENDAKGKDISIVSFFSMRNIDNGVYSISMYARERPFSLQSFVGLNEKNYQAVLPALESSDYLLLKSGQVMDHHYSAENYKLLVYMSKILKGNHVLLQSYKKIGTVSVPVDKSSVSIYKRVKGRDEGIQEFYKALEDTILR